MKTSIGWSLGDLNAENMELAIVAREGRHGISSYHSLGGHSSGASRVVLRRFGPVPEWLHEQGNHQGNDDDRWRGETPAGLRFSPLTILPMRQPHIPQ